MSKETPLIFGSELAKIQLTKVSKYSFGDFVSSVCPYLHLYWSGVFFTEFWIFYTKTVILKNIANFTISLLPFNHKSYFFLSICVSSLKKQIKNSSQRSICFQKCCFWTAIGGKIENRNLFSQSVIFTFALRKTFLFVIVLKV